MNATSPAGAIPAHELLDRLPPADEIRARMDELDAEKDALMPLLRAAIRAQKRRRRKPPTAAQRQEEQR